MKRVILGFIAGSIVTLGVSTFADDITSFVAQKATFDVMVNGEKLKSDKPVVAIDGSTYLPLKDTGEALGVPVVWNAEKKQVEVGNQFETPVETEPTPIIVTSSPEPIQVTPSPKKSNEGAITMKIGDYYIKSKHFDTDQQRKYPLYDINGEQYIAINCMGIVASDSQGSYIKLLDKEPVYILKDGQLTENAYKDISKDPLVQVKLSALGLEAVIEGDTALLEWK